MVTAETVAAAAIRKAVMATIKEGEEDYGYPGATLYEMAARGVPGFVRNGRNIRIHRPTFERWLEEQAQGPRDGHAA
ncbi:MAG: hypothetical protein ACR2JW_17515 [Thermomicrobiales bacterium]